MKRPSSCEKAMSPTRSPPISKRTVPARRRWSVDPSLISTSSTAPPPVGWTKPNHYLEILRTVWDNRHDLPYAWRILSRGVCDGCALGVAGFRDWTMEGIHLCTTRLDLLKLNTARALDPTALADVPTLP